MWGSRCVGGDSEPLDSGPGGREHGGIGATRSGKEAATCRAARLITRNRHAILDPTELVGLHKHVKKQRYYAA